LISFGQQVVCDRNRVLFAILAGVLERLVTVVNGGLQGILVRVRKKLFGRVERVLDTVIANKLEGLATGLRCLVSGLGVALHIGLDSLLSLLLLVLRARSNCIRQVGVNQALLDVPSIR